MFSKKQQFSCYRFWRIPQNLLLLSQLKLWKIELKVFIKGKNAENRRTFKKYLFNRHMQLPKK